MLPLGYSEKLVGDSFNGATASLVSFNLVDVDETVDRSGAGEVHGGTSSAIATLTFVRV